MGVGAGGGAGGGGGSSSGAAVIATVGWKNDCTLGGVMAAAPRACCAFAALARWREDECSSGCASVSSGDVAGVAVVAGPTSEREGELGAEPISSGMSTIASTTNVNDANVSAAQGAQRQ